MSVRHYFAYGSNMNLERMRGRDVNFDAACGASLPDLTLVFDKVAKAHPGVAHANVRYARGARVEGVLYRLSAPDEILKLDVFERTPINYSREVVRLRGYDDAREHEAGHLEVDAWIYFANPAVVAPGLLPDREYLAHLLAGQPYLSSAYHRRLQQQPVADLR